MEGDLIDLMQRAEAIGLTAMYVTKRGPLWDAYVTTVRPAEALGPNGTGEANDPDVALERALRAAIAAADRDPAHHRRLLNNITQADRKRNVSNGVADQFEDVL
jgi:hypothetical protein